MDIDDFTSKLVIDYSEKEKSCDLLLADLRQENRRLRREGKEIQDRMEVVSQIRVLEAQKIAYVQARADIRAIQDQLGIG